MTDDLDAPGVPRVGARRFSDRLWAIVRCRLAWNHQRQCFVVYRPHGRHSEPDCYMDIGRDKFPLDRGLLSEVCRVVQWTDADQHQDRAAMLKTYQRRDAERLAAERRGHVNERLGEFWKDMRRNLEIVTDGRRRTKFLDLGAMRRKGIAR